MKNIIITGSSGMVGSLVLDMCLASDDVGSVTTLVRRKSGIDHPKLTEVVHDDFLDYSGVTDHFNDKDVCLFCLGVYTGAVPKDEFRKITVDYTRVLAETLRAASDKTTFCFLSGQGADREEKSRIMFARDKGVAENILLGLGFDKTFIFRPGYIYPSIPRQYQNFVYNLMAYLYKPVLSRIYPNIGITSSGLAMAIVTTGLYGGDKETLENRDIRGIAGER